MAEQPIYRRIADTLREQIESGKLQPGQKLPTETKLREEYDASRNTIRDAIKWLTSLALVETRPGQGTFVVKKADPFITTLSADTGTGLGGGEGATYLSQVSEQDRVASSTEPQVEMQKAAGAIAARLELEEGAQLISRHQKRYIDNTPWSLQTSFYPRELAKGADRLLEPSDIEEGTVRYLAETLGLRQVGYRDWITVRTPNDHEAEFFDLPEDGRVGVFEVFRTAYDQTGAPMRLTVTIFPTDRNQFVVNDGQVPPIPARRDASTKKSLANPLQAGQTTLVSWPQWWLPIPQGPTLELTKYLALCSRITGLFFRCLLGTASAATAGNDARRTTSTPRPPRSYLRPFLLAPASGSLHDGPRQDRAPRPASDEPATAPMLITQATVGDLPTVLGLINGASKWLRTKGTDQWTQAWPSEPERDMRVLAGLRNGKTWIVWDGDVAAATVTIANSYNPDVWEESDSTCDLLEKAVYVHRLIIDRKYAGTGLGAELINWAGLRGKRKNRAKWIRIDVWTSNLALHAFYKNIGFAACGTCTKLIYLPGYPDGLVYPSGALFQKPISEISPPARPQFAERTRPLLAEHADPVTRDTGRHLVGAGQSAE